MSTDALTLMIPAALARELESASQEFLVELLERGLRQLKIERALERYARGGVSFGVSQSELARQACARGMEPPSSAETLAEELS